MARWLRSSLSLCVLLSQVGRLIAQQPVSPTPSISPSDFKFSGEWNCGGAFRNGKLHNAVFTANLVIGGKWIELDERDTEPATGYVAKYLLGYDPQQKTFVEFDANNFGAATYTSSEGWQKRVLTMTSPVSSDPKVPYAVNRFLYEVVDDDTFTVDWQISKTPSLTWLQAHHLLCKRN